MTSAKLEALKALALVVLTALASVGVIATDVPNVVAPVVAALAAAVGVFTIHRPQDVAANQANAAVADTVHDVARSGISTFVDIKTEDTPQGVVVTPVVVSPAVQAAPPEVPGV